jgi:SAM-dependent methyltransferase
VRALGLLDGGAGAPSIADQHGALNDYCARKGWQLVDVRTVSSAADRTLAVDAVDAGGADVALAAVSTGLWASANELRALLERSRGKWHLAVTESLVDTTSPSGVRFAHRWRARLDRSTEPSPTRAAAPLPPPDLVRRVTGSTDLEHFDSSGALDVADFEAALTRTGRHLRDFGHGFDFGCGCGRLLRHLGVGPDAATLAGSDIDAAAIEWLTAAMPTVDARVNAALPPLPFDRARFDLVVAYSVFTHLDEKYQDAWLEELQRVTKPGAVLLVTINGELSWDVHRDTVLAGRAELAALESQRNQHGIAFWTGDGWEAEFPDFYHTTFHTPAYVRERWGRWFDVELVTETGSLQDVAVLSRPATP